MGQARDAAHTGALAGAAMAYLDKQLAPRPLSTGQPVLHSARTVLSLSKLKSRLFGAAPATSSSSAAAPAVSPRPARSEEAPVTSRTMRIVRVVRETDDALTLVFAPVDGASVTFVSGQFLNLELRLPEGPLWRAYSLCSAPSSGELAITVKRIEGGRGSTFLHQHAREGLSLEVRGPSGTFVLPTSKAPRHVLLIAGGSGITPMLSHTRSLLEDEPESRITLLYGNRAERDVIFRKTLDALRAAHPGRFTLRHVLVEPSATLEAGSGMLDQQTALAELRALGVAESAPDLCLLCGPTPMMNATRGALLALGVPEAHILEERFSAPTTTVDPASDATQQVQVRLGGKLQSFSVASGETILDASLRAELVLDFSCTTGACGTCTMHLREGAVHMEEPNCLTPQERAAGLILPCVSRPKSACTLEPVA